MLVARRSFVATVDGEPVAVHRGRTRVHPDHPLAARHPLRFEPVPGVPDEIRTAIDDYARTAIAREPHA